MNRKDDRRALTVQPISVVMSVYNGEAYLREAIESILEQSFADFEFIIVDDGSTDKSANIIRSYGDHRIRLIQQENRGLAAALNVGLKETRGQYIARMDADDISLVGRLKAQYDFLEAHPECVAVGSNVMLIDSQGNYLYTSDQATDWEEIQRLLPRTPFYHSSTMFRTDAALQCGGYFEPIRHYFEDIVFFNRLARMGELRNLHIPLLKYRMVPSALSNVGSSYAAILDITKRILEQGTISEEDQGFVERITQGKPNWKKSNYHLQLGRIYLEKNFRRGKALKQLLLSLLSYPWNGPAWFNVGLALLPRRAIHRWRGWRNRRYDGRLRDGANSDLSERVHLKTFLEKD